MWETMTKESVLRKLKTTKQIGLTETEAKERLKTYGKNELKDKKKEGFFIKLLKQFSDFMIIILIVASIVSAVLSYIQGTNDYLDSIIIIAIVIVNAVMGVVQESKAEKSIEALKKLAPDKATVVRNRKTKEINAYDLVPGDIIILDSGNYVPADCRILESVNFRVEESSLTGETEAVSKNENSVVKKNAPLGDIKNMVFMSSNVTGGHAKAVVTETGMNTKVGKIAGLMINSETPQTPIQKRLDQIGKALGLACLIICAVIFGIGLLKKIEPMEMFMTSVGLAVAAIPEGLPATVTIILSIGVSRMAKKRSIVRKLPAVETLGSSNVICSDKTGTLTQNKMAVTETYTQNIKLLLELGAMCNTCVVDNLEVKGEATEVAIVKKALDSRINKNDLYNLMPKINEIPFDSNRKMMTTIHKLQNGYRVITKGAPDILINKCTAENKETIRKENEKMANKALRVIAVAYKDIDKLPPKIEDVENNLNFVGLIGMIDPPRKGVKEAVDTCRKAGIKTVMITGDHKATAIAIAKELHILNKEDKAMTGEELESISQEELEKVIQNYSVFARVTPEHKVRIVKAWQKTGAVVAMTGDGVNDSPALKNADIGIAMGKNGTDVAKNASDMILTDDNFVTIVEAVKQGRNIYDNIKKAIHFSIATNIGEIVAIFVGLILGFESPLLALQLLWINMVTDSFPAIALGLEKPEKNIMERKPVDSRKGLFADGLWEKIITEGLMIGMLTLVVFSIGNKYFGIEVARTMTFMTLGISEIIHSFNIKSEQSIFKSGIFENKYLILSLVGGIAMQLAVVLIPSIAAIFELVPLSGVQWLITLAISLLPIPIMEVQKAYQNKSAKMQYKLRTTENG